MIFKSIKLSNFRQFRNNDVITFSTDPKNNVTLFVADNNVGKTTLLQAFLWCLYGEAKLDNEQNLANVVEFNKLPIGALIEVAVELELISECKEYIISRKIMVSKNNESKQIIMTKPENQLNIFIKLENGTTVTESNRLIEKLFPRELSDYFFFDGERMRDLGNSTPLAKKDISIAVKSIFNLDVLEKVDRNLSDILKKWNDKKVVAKESYDQFQKVKLEIQKNEIALAQSRKKLTETELLHNKYNDLIKKNEEFLFDKKMLTVQVESRKYLENNITNIEKRITDLKNEVKKDFLKNAIDIHLSKYLVETRTALSKYDTESKMISGINANAIKEIIKRNRCICGQELHGNTDHHVIELLSLLDYLPPENLGILLKTLISILESKENYKNNVIENIYSKINSLNSEYQNLSDAKDRIHIINKDIEKIAENYDEVLNAEKRLAAAKNENKDLPATIRQIRKNIEIYEDNLNKLRRYLDKLTENYGDNTKLFKRIAILEDVKKSIKEDISRQELNIRKQLTNKVQQYLDMILKTRYSIIIDRFYNFSIIDGNNNQVTGEGYKVVVSFAYIAGIIELVNEKIISFTLPESFPLVMDAPFAKLDDHNRQSINKLLPKIARQVILFTTDSQWYGSVENELNNVLGKKYEMRRYTEEDVANGITRIKEMM